MVFGAAGAAQTPKINVFRPAQKHVLKTQAYGKAFDAGLPQVGAGFLSFCGFSRLLLVCIGLPAGVLTVPALG